MNRQRINIDQKQLAAFCQQHGIRSLRFFGSVLRDDFGPMSDVDAEDALRYAANRTRQDLDDDSMLLRALYQCIEVIGEAASRTTPDLKGANSTATLAGNYQDA